MRLIFTLALLLRILNCLVVQTWFEPDEYFQTLEPAHRLAFGYGYLTWEWREGLRSYIYPLTISLLYRISAALSIDSRCVLVIIPKLFHSVLGAVSDLYYYKTIVLLFSHDTAVLVLLTYWLNWFQFFCTPRTLSNTVEMQLLLIGLYYYDWPLTLIRSRNVKRWKPSIPTYASIAFISTVVRPTSAVIWAPLIFYNFISKPSENKIIERVYFYWVWKWNFGWSTICVLIDYLCYGRLTFSTLNFFAFNFLSAGSAHFGVHPWHWFFTNGLPTVLFVHTIPVILGMAKSDVRWIAYLSLFYVAMHSLIPHKELRFLLPIIPLLNIYAGIYLESTSLLSSAIKNCQNISISTYFSYASKRAKTILFLLFITNLPLIIYTCLIHQRGVLDITAHLNSVALKSISNGDRITIWILAPCHTTPLFSHIHVDVSLRFLTCEPNLQNLANYVDEADQFYVEPISWLNKEWKSLGDDQLPSQIVMFESLWTNYVNKWFANKGFKKCARFFNTHFPISARQSSYLLLICKMATTYH